MLYLRVLVSGFGIASLAFGSVIVSMNVWDGPNVLRQGDSVPDFAAQTLAGKRVEFASLKGRIVVLHVWASWCPPCRREMPLLDTIQQEYGSRGVTVVGLDLHEPPAVVKAYVEVVGVSYPIWVDVPAPQTGISPNRDLYDRLNVVGLPTTLFIDPNGSIRGRHLGELNQAVLQERINALGLN